MINAVVVDDEVLVLDHLKRLLKESGKVRIVGEFTDPDIALEEIARLKPDVVFLDVEMPGINGIELGTELLELEKEIDIVFVTAYEQYAIHAFKLNAVNYILKPADRESIDETVNRIAKRRGNGVQSQDRGKIFVFGDVCILTNKTGKKVKWITSKVEELFALLLLNHERGASKWKIIDLLWGESDSEKSMQNLYTSIFRLKKTLKDTGIKAEIENRAGVYRMNLEDVFCDFLEFEAFIKKKITVDRQTIGEYEEAISLYRGDLFADRDYWWSIAEREKCYENYVELVKRAASYYIANECTSDLKKLYNKAKFLLRKEDLPDIKRMITTKF
ncbi:MAG: response regulator [Tepidanaerobacteraceae bacterium]|nr:response regulator [Tepidanaerobacteraceae bacterium]